MKLILAGCEYSGTTTLANGIVEWGERTMGAKMGLHDHFKIPHLSHDPLTEEEQAGILALSPNVLEMFQRYHVDYHLIDEFLSSPDHLVVGMHFDEAVYAPLYFGYGMKGIYGNRERFFQRTEQSILKDAPDMVLVLLKASPEVIAERMKQEPHQNQVIKTDDIEHVLGRFQELYERSAIAGKFALDTSTASVEETLSEFVRKIEPHLTTSDQLRLLAHRVLR